MMHKKSLCFQITLATALILFLCSAALTFFSVYHAGMQFSAVVVKMAELPSSVNIDSPEMTGADIPAPLITNASIVSEAKLQFNLAGIAAMLLITAFGTGLAYAAAKKPLCLSAHSVIRYPLSQKMIWIYQSRNTPVPPVKQNYYTDHSTP